MSRFQRLTTAFAVLLVAAPLAAQGSAPAQDSTVAAAAAPAPIVERAPAGPTQANAAVGIRANVATNTPTPMKPEGDVGRNPAMMIVGGVAIIVGALVGGNSGTIIMIAGGGLGLYGLWQYLK